MSDGARVPDILSDVLSRFEELRQTPLARGLAEVRIGPTSVWDAVRYEVADAIYDETYRELRPQEAPKSLALNRGRFHRAGENVRRAVLRNLWQGQLSEEFLVGLLSARLGLIGDLLEKSLIYAHRHGTENRRRIDVMVAGSLYRTPVTALSPVLQRLRSRHGLEYLVLAHDDVLLRHGRAFRRLGIRWCNAAIFSKRAHETLAREVVAGARTALGLQHGSESHLLRQVVSGKFLSQRYLRRLALNLLAAREALSQLRPSVVVIPDERQPLARLVGLEARRRGVPVVSAPHSRDQIFRKMPLWDSIVSTRILVFSPLAARFLGRAGASPRVFESTSGLPLEMGTPMDRARLQLRFREILKLEADSRIVLFASQGNAVNAILLPMLNASIAAFPNVRLVIRPHPYESPPLVRLMNPGVRVSVAFSARQAIQATDLLVTHSSFMAVEAALLCCPVILVSPDVPSLMPLVTEGLATWASTGQELHSALEDLLGNENSRVRAAQERFRTEQAAIGGIERAADLIAELARANGEAATLDKPGRVTL